MPSFVFDRCYGAIETLSPLAIPAGFVTSAVNVDLSSATLFKPRGGTVSVLGATGAPSGPVKYVFTRRDSGSEAFWAFWQANLAATPEIAVSSSSGTVWPTAISLTDTPAVDSECSIVAYGGKVFIAYNSAVNRLHVYDSLSTSPAVRRVGLDTPAAATVGNTGAGTYAATLRYYKVQMLIHRDPSDASTPVHASSELSDAVSFTPSGGGTAARITKPTTIDSATHWRIYGSTDNITFYQITGDLAVATTTYDDNVTPSNYYAFNGVTAPDPGLFIPPPSAKFLATNGERIFMAGSHETTATSTQTAVNNRRVWFTRPLGATDAGDDESITQTSASRYWVDLDNDDGSSVTALASTVDGSIYAGTATSLWRLYDTGSPDKPIRAERVVSGVGPVTAASITASDAVSGEYVYFATDNGPYRYSPSSGVEFLGADWVRPSTTEHASKPRCEMAAFDPRTKRVYWKVSGGEAQGVGNVMRVLDPSLLRNIDGSLRGGWSVNEYGANGSQSEIYGSTVLSGKLFLCGKFGNSGSTGWLFYHGDATALDAGDQGYTAEIVTPDATAGDGARNMRIDEAYLFKPRTMPVSLEFRRNRGGTGNTQTDTVPSYPSDPDAFHRFKVEGLYLADAYAFGATISTSDIVVNATTRHTDGADRLVVPYTVQEAG
ncbi:MAG: hypothetical protein E6Q97_28395 [Desulfurellales bacterium]|nr:MAG: hypothetical protein E6Q97_28395 [Desulfurellales bacterium]